MRNIKEMLCEQGHDSMCFNSTDVADYGDLFAEVEEKVFPEDQLTEIARLTRAFSQAEYSGDQLESKRYFDLIRAFISGRTKDEGQ